jgi:hypothetical protein
MEPGKPCAHWAPFNGATDSPDAPSEPGRMSRHVGRIDLLSMYGCGPFGTEGPREPFLLPEVGLRRGIRAAGSGRIDQAEGG